MLKRERQDFILQRLENEGAVRVSNLAEILDVNPVTVRRDLNRLEERGLLHRVHGGAVLRAQTAPVGAPTELERRIAQAAARFIPDDSVVFLGPGTLTRETVPFLKSHTSLTLITNALDVAWGVARQQQHTLHLMGGQVDADFGVYGVADALNDIRADQVILEASGLDAERGLTHDHRDYAEMARQLFALSTQTVVLLTPERLGRAGALFISPAIEVDVLITGREADNAPLWDLSELGVRIILT
jgi:DeoR/GlpR family transcriptional regulator of sugar metabolism